MKVTWEEIDIEGGRLVVRNVPDPTNVPEPTTEDWWIISWRMAPPGNIYSLVSFADGMIMEIANGTKQAVANWLNENDYHPAELYVVSDE